MKNTRIAGGLIGLALCGGILGSAGAAFADTGATPVKAGSDTATGGATVVVDGSLSLSLVDTDKSFTLEGLTGAANVTAPDNTISYNVKTNNYAGYSVSVQADQAALAASTPGNTDVVPFSAVNVQGDGTHAGDQALSNTTADVIHEQSGRSAGAAGDTNTAKFDIPQMPFVNADSYTGTVTFTAAAK